MGLTLPPTPCFSSRSPNDETRRTSCGNFLRIPSEKVFLQSVQRGIETLLKIYDVSSTADKGGSRGVIEDKTPFLGKESGFFCFMGAEE